MSATFNLFVRWTEAKGFKSVNQGAIALGVPRQTVQNWKDGRNGEAMYIVKMCNDLGENPTKTVLEAYAEKEKGESARVLMKLSKQFGAIVMLITLSIVPNPSQERTGDNFAYSVGNIYYVSVNAVQVILCHFRRLFKWTYQTSMHHLA